jgi:hypothetical protein
MNAHLVYRDNKVDFDEEVIDMVKQGYRPIGGISIAYHEEQQCMYFSLLMIKGR